MSESSRSIRYSSESQFINKWTSKVIVSATKGKMRQCNWEKETWGPGLGRVIKEGLLAKVTSGLRPSRSGASLGKPGLPHTGWILCVWDSAPVNACQVSSPEGRPLQYDLKRFLGLMPASCSCRMPSFICRQACETSNQVSDGKSTLPKSEAGAHSLIGIAGVVWSPSGSGSSSGTLWRGVSLLPPWPDLESGQTSTPWWMPTDVCPNLMGLESKAGSRWAWRRERHGP